MAREVGNKSFFTHILQVLYIDLPNKLTQSTPEAALINILPTDYICNNTSSV
jgi:hypothetical protein